MGDWIRAVTQGTGVESDQEQLDIALEVFRWIEEHLDQGFVQMAQERAG